MMFNIEKKQSTKPGYKIAMKKKNIVQAGL